MDAPIPVNTEYRDFRIQCQGREYFVVFDCYGVLIAYGLVSLESAKEFIDIWMGS